MDDETEEFEPQNKRGPKGPSKILTDQDFNMLLSMVRIQCTQTEICEILGMSDTTLNRRLKERDYENFEDLYKKHNSEGKMSLRRFQWQAAEKGNATMQIWLGKQYLGQRDKINAELTGEGGGPIITRVESFFVEPPSSD